MHVVHTAVVEFSPTAAHRGFNVIFFFTTCMCYADDTELLCSLVERRVGIEPGGGSSGCAEVADRCTFYRAVVCVYGVHRGGVAAVWLYCGAYVAARAL